VPASLNLTVETALDNGKVELGQFVAPHTTVCSLA
jgi:hypothetical protein